MQKRTKKKVAERNVQRWRKLGKRLVDMME
jgi:hypothetical protein